MAVDWGLLKERPTETYYDIPSPAFLPHNIEQRISNTDHEVFGDHYRERIKSGLEKLKGMSSREKQYTFQDLCDELTDFKFEETERLLEIANGSLIFKRTRLGGYMVDAEIKAILQGYLENL